MTLSFLSATFSRSGHMCLLPSVFEVASNCLLLLDVVDISRVTGRDDSRVPGSIREPINFGAIGTAQRAGPVFSLVTIGNARQEAECPRGLEENCLKGPRC